MYLQWYFRHKFSVQIRSGSGTNMKQAIRLLFYSVSICNTGLGLDSTKQSPHTATGYHWYLTRWSLKKVPW